FIACSVVTTLLIPLYDRELCLWASETFSIRWGVLIASILLFLPPLTFLGFVSPYALRLALRQVSQAGRTAGLLYAISTAGSVIGSIVAGFHLVPGLGVTLTLVIIAVVLAIPCVLWALTARQAKAAVGIAALTVLLSALSAWRAEARPYANGDTVRLLHEAEGRYARIGIAEIRADPTVPDSEWVRWILIDGIPQTGVLAPDQDLVAPSRWYENFTPLHAVQSQFYRLHGREIKTALLIGLGGGAVPMALEAQGIETEVVDIDPLVVENAAEWMGFDPEQVPVHIMDGRAFIRRCDRTFDLVIFDVATGGNQPFHLFSREIFEETDRILAPGGVLAINYIGFVSEERNFLTRAVVATISSIFSERACYIYPPASRRRRDSLCNIMLFFSHEPFADDRAVLRDPSTSPEDRRMLERQFIPLREDIAPSDFILTDDRNPIERHSVAINEVWRRQVFVDFQRELNRL
ncbi:fused MFS/spermidine synthase, partial [Candidatus Sumerlaeota bacterium]|nr:fused MFS/spermidine synthase [Candidatus Sumerlaeota bacterium]